VIEMFQHIKVRYWSIHYHFWISMG